MNDFQVVTEEVIKTQKLRYWILFLTSIIIISVGVFIEFFFHASQDFFLRVVLPLIVSEIGIAIGIALVIIFTIERDSRAQHFRDSDEVIGKIADNVFRAIYKRYISEKVFTEVEQSFLYSSILRRNYEIDYAIAYKDPDKSNSSEYLECIVSTSYKLVNVTKKSVTHAIEIHLEISVDGAQEKQMGFKPIMVNGNLLDVSDDDIETTHCQKY